MSAFIQIKGVSRWFGREHTQVRALTDINLSFAAGEQAALVGPSGSGKTTLLNLVGALDRPTAGQIHLGGQLLSAFTEHQAAEFRRREAGFVFQDSALLPELTLWENVELPLVLIGLPRLERKQRIEPLLQALDLNTRSGAFPPELSGGEKQRAAVARAVVHQPRIVLADEPTANLDTPSAQAVLDILRQLAQQHQLTMLVATHDPRVYTRFQRIIHLEDGE